MNILFLQRVFLFSLLLLLRWELSDAAGGLMYLGSWEQQTWERRKHDMGCQEKYISVDWDVDFQHILFTLGEKEKQIKMLSKDRC